jgi:hypothetical protein
MRQPPTQVRGPLAEALVTLAGTPDDMSTVDDQLRRIVQLAADRISTVAYASVTVQRDGANVTVAMSSEVALAVDAAQYDDDDGPCLESLRRELVVAVSQIDRTISWPGFRHAAAGLGLHTSVSLPIFAGSGKTIAALNLYGRDTVAMAPLVARLLAVYDPEESPADERPLDDGGDELVAGLSEAMTVRAAIQLAIGAVVARTATTPDNAYLRLRLHAATTGVPLPDAAEALISQGL